MKHASSSYVFSIVFAVLAMIVSTFIAAQYTKSTTLALEDKKLVDARLPERALGIRNAQFPLIIYEVDEKAGTITAIVHSRLAGQDIPLRLKISSNFEVDRQDAIVEDGIVVGATNSVPATIADLKKGVRGYGMTSLSDSGEAVITYLLIGDPFPRP